MSWSEVVAKFGREREKQFLNYSLDFFRQALMVNYGALYLVHLEISDVTFSLEKFAKFIDAQNIESICDEIERAIYHIERNANGKIVLTDLSIKLTRLLHQNAKQD
jgi:DNA polymerase-3 subunit delta'